MSKRISKTAAFDLLSCSCGRFCSVDFKTNDGRDRKINGKVVGVTKLGYIQVKENSTKRKKGGIRNVNSQNIKGLRVNRESLVVS